MENPESTDSYKSCLDAMQEAAHRWVKQHPFAELRFTAFEQEIAREFGKPGERPAIVATLSQVIDRWAANEDARQFLQALDRATQGEGTYMMASAIVEQAMERHLERGQGQLPRGDWRCTGCAAACDGFTRTDGVSAPPEPGALSVCYYCAALQRVNASASGYEPLTTRDLHELPKSLRMRLLSMKRSVEQRLAKDRSRS